MLCLLELFKFFLTMRIAFESMRFIYDKNQASFYIDFLTSVSYARPTINYFELLGSWSGESASLDHINLEFHGLNTFASEKLYILSRYEEDGRIEIGQVMRDGSYGNYTMNVTTDEGILSHSALWISASPLKIPT